MNIILPPPPQVSHEKEFERFMTLLYELLRPHCSSSPDANAAIPSLSEYHAVTALSAPRTLTLPETRYLRDGQDIVVQDESGLAGTHTITVVAAAGENVYGAATITSNYGRRRIIKSQKGKWYSQ